MAGQGDAAKAATSQHSRQVKGTHLNGQSQLFSTGNHKDSHGTHFLSLATVFSVKHTVWVNWLYVNQWIFFIYGHAISFILTPYFAVKYMNNAS